ncbi:MAG: hypothetical protein Q7J29_15655 [Stagnimonas sp.]|nr:hypothetical protein [Stagnimonas sp.]
MALSLSAWAAHAAEPYTPSSSDTVLLQRAAGAAKALREARGLSLPSDPASRVAAAQAAIDRGRSTGDPRYFGQAQALLGSDWTAPSPSLPVRLVRATLLQQRHDFAAALADLDAVLATDARNAQAHLIRANIRMVQGEPQRARPDCAALIGQAGLLVTATCIGTVGGLTGQAKSALQAIELTLAREPEAPRQIRIWALTQAAEIAERLGDLPRATEHYATALAEATAAGENDVYLKAAYADFLLDQQRSAEVKTLLAGEADFDPLLLRLALAEQQLAAAGDSKASGAAALHLKALQERHALVASRGDPPHRREQGMAALHLQRDAKAALVLAQQNWAEQREPADARLLLQAALAAGDHAAAEPVRVWMLSTKIEDVRLKPLLVQLDAAP